MKPLGLVFDFGGVMTPMQMPELVHLLATNLGVAWADVLAGYKKYRRRMDADLISMEEMYRRIWADMKLYLSPAVCRELVEADLCGYLARDEQVLDLMRQIKAKGFKLGILTNMATRFAVHFRHTFADFIALADAMVISGEEHCYKPQRVIYDLMQARLGLPAASLLFVDDVEENCEAARQAGWRAIRFQSVEQLGEQLRKEQIL